jgi:putative PIN family toxin of toxin-antitoxin system
MHKLVIDTNVLISHCISPLGFSSRIIDHVILYRRAKWHVSNPVLEEYLDVLNRPRFSKKYPGFPEAGRLLIDAISVFSVFDYPQRSFDIILDKSDNKFLDLAFAANADFIITGNSLDFTIKEFYNTKIVSPQEYWNNHIQL